MFDDIEETHLAAAASRQEPLWTVDADGVVERVTRPFGGR